MAALTITPSQVIQGEDAKIAQGRLGATVTAGQPVYFDENTRRYYPADANTTLQGADVVGIPLNGGAAGQSVRIQTEGTITLGAGAAPVVGTVYVLGAIAAGDIVPAADLASGWYRTILGVGASDNTLVLGIFASGVLP